MQIISYVFHILYLNITTTIMAISKLIIIFASIFATALPFSTKNGGPRLMGIAKILPLFFLLPIGLGKGAHQILQKKPPKVVVIQKKEESKLPQIFGVIFAGTTCITLTIKYHKVILAFFDKYYGFAVPLILSTLLLFTITILYNTKTTQKPKKL